MNQLNSSNNVPIHVEEEPTITIRDIIGIVLHKWYWFVISTIVCLSCAVLYLMWTPKIYERTATVLIKGENTNQREAALFQDLPIFEGNYNVNNEMIVFKSYSLIAEAVRRLKIDISYTVKNSLRTQELYSQTPVALSFIEFEDTQWMTLKARLLPDNKILLWDLKTNGFDDSQPRIVQLNDTINTGFGLIVASPTLWYNDIWFDKIITVKKNSFVDIANRYRNTIAVSLADKQTSVINLSLKDASIQRAEDLLNTIISIYNEYAIDDKNAMAVNTENFINERLIIIEQELGEVDERIESYKISNQLTDIQSNAQMALQESSESDRTVNMLQNRRAVAVYIRDYLSNPSNSTELIPANSGIEDINLEGHIINYNETMLRRNRLIANSTERNPVVQDLNNSLISMRQNILRAIDNLIVNLDIQIRSVIARTDRTRARIAAVPQQQSAITSISRQQQIKEDLFLYLLNKREENALNKAITESTARIIDPAIGPYTPVAPRSLVVMAAAFLLGLIIPSGLLYLFLLSDTTVRGRKDLESALSVPFLGEVPFLKIKDKSKHKVAVIQSGRDPVSEAFRIIRTNMDFLQVKQEQPKVIMATSSLPGSGKTFVSSNLAVSLAMSGKKVILIDMDLRKRTLGKFLEATHHIEGNAIGLSSYLSYSLDEINELIIQDNAFPNIDVILAGPEPPNHADLLLSPRLEELIDQLKTLYDYIIIDSTPIRLVADAMITNRVADITLFIVRIGKMDRRMLPDIENMYREDKLKNMAMLLNGIGSGIGYGFGYGYGYGYNYGYSYGE